MLTPTIKALAFTLLAATFMVSSTGLYAQTDNQETEQQPWYQIELFIFAYQQAADSNTEVWPKELGLKYPQRIVELKKAAQTEVLLNDWSDTPEPDATEVTEEPTEANEEPLLVDNNQPPLPEPLLVTLKEQPFTLLPEDQLSFTDMTRKLLRQKDLRQLFYGAWRQPIGKRNDSESLLIRGGDPFDNHFELEGSISLGLERYLHVTTDLWLSTFVSNAGRTENPWPVLPKVPVASSANSGTETSDQDTGDIFSQTNPGSSSGTIFINNNDLENPFVDLAGNQYAVDQTATMRQSRRMRSNELHYIDHPLMGLLVRITPYEFPEPQAGQASGTAINEAQPAPPSVAP